MESFLHKKGFAIIQLDERIVTRLSTGTSFDAFKGTLY